jgi:hypothetical protein
VTWQEELRKLDEDLASGTLSADAYRARRDQILSAAVTSAEPGEPANQDTNQSAATQIIEPVSPPTGIPQPSNQQPSNSEATQVVSSYDTSAERTQAVAPWQGQPVYQQPGAPSPPGGFAQQQPPVWNAPHEDPSPPWGGSELPPIAPQGGFGWVSQGPENFDSDKPSGKGRKILFSALAAIVIAGLGVAVWLLFVRDNGSDVAAEPGQQPPAATTKPLPMPPAAKQEPASDQAALIIPPGTPRSGGGNFGLAALSSNKLLPPTVIAALDQAGMRSGRLNTSIQGTSTIGLFSLTLPDAQAAATVASQYAQTQQQGGLAANRGLAMQGVPVLSTATSQQTVFRAVYVLYSRVIIVETFGSDRAAVQDLFSSVLQQQVDHAPPTQHTP